VDTGRHACWTLVKLSELPVVTIAKLRGRARGAGSELALACDMRFAARENAILGRSRSELTLPGADAIRADARRFRQLVVSDAATARTAALFAQGLQTRGPLELDLGDRIGSL
jgi:enoyl-CoA hydratase/carnithine racemase